jgi:aerobic carbon-monoxide dehydrogenase medium subunit
VKPPPFSYADPDSLAETLDLLAVHGPDAKVLAGGQSLMPLLNFRLARPALIVDINRVPELRRFASDAAGGLRIGATVRQRELERSAELARANPLLAETLPLIGHFQIRNRGTICGSLAHADPAAELPAVAVALDAELTVVRRGGSRLVTADDFFVSYLTTCLEDDELLSEVRFPPWTANDGWAIEELTRRDGDFALAGVVVRLSAPGGICTRAGIVAFGFGGRPQRLRSAERRVLGSAIGKATADVEQVVRQEVEVEDDHRASAAYRSKVTGVLCGRALARAWERATTAETGS